MPKFNGLLGLYSSSSSCLLGIWGGGGLIAFVFLCCWLLPLLLISLLQVQQNRVRLAHVLNFVGHNPTACTAHLVFNLRSYF